MPKKLWLEEGKHHTGLNSLQELAAEGLVVERKGRKVLQLSDHTFEPVDPNARHL